MAGFGWKENYVLLLSLWFEYFRSLRNSAAAATLEAIGGGGDWQMSWNAGLDDCRLPSHRKLSLSWVPSAFECSQTPLLLHHQIGIFVAGEIGEHKHSEKPSLAENLSQFRFKGVELLYLFTRTKIKYFYNNIFSVSSRFRSRLRAKCITIRITSLIIGKNHTRAIYDY